MNRDQLRKQAQSRRNQAEDEGPEKVKWLCQYCQHPFAYEKTFMSHRCRDRERLDELRGPIGQAAYAHYSDWMKAKKRSVPPIETFATSQFYTTFIKFAEYAVKTNIPNTSQFIKLMVENGDLSPGLWCRDNVYAMYIEWYDVAYPPEVQLVESLDFLKELCVELSTTPGEIFSQIPVNTLVQHITRRKISPWFLVSSKVFRAFLLTCDAEDKEKLERAMKLGAMIARIQKDTGLFELFNRVTLAEGF